SVINEFNGKAPYTRDGRVKPFKKTGKLVLITGRVSSQKGFDLVFDLIPDLVKKFPETYFLFLVLPTQGEISLVRSFIEKSLKKPFNEHVRLVFGKEPSIYHVAHLASDFYLAPSKWEPFGITVLEAHSMKLPVVGSKVGGIQETVIDIIDDPELGTGILYENNDGKNLFNAFSDMVSLINIASLERKRQELINKKEDRTDNDEIASVTTRLKKEILKVNNEKLRNIVKNEPEIFYRIKENALMRVERDFRWKIVSRKELVLIEKALKNLEA
ncbi:MAG: glycosyltransferase, partial [Promethearchaeota archaeon]